MIQTIDNMSQRLIGTLQRFPLASFSAFLLTIIVVSLIELDSTPKSEVIIMASKIAFVASLGIVLFPALRLLKSHFLMTLLGIGVIAGYYYILPTDIYEAQTNIFFRHTLLILALFLMFIWAPFLSVKISNKNIWEWTQNLILALFSTTLFSLILYAGVSLAFYAIDNLFEIEIEAKRYAQLGVMVFGLYGVNFFLSQIPKYILLLQVRTYTKIEIIFTKYILTSLAIGYFFILFAYSAKILITMEWPTGTIAWISILFSVVAIMTYLFWTPLWREENIRFKRVIWIAILLQTIMLGMAIWIRVEEYGITESRYFIALFGAWLVLMSFYFIFIKNASYKWLFVSLSILLVASQFGKYSATEVSKNNQIVRLQQMIDDAKSLSEKLDIQTKQNIYRTIEYLEYNHGIDSLQTVIPKVVAEYKEANSTVVGEYDFAHFAIKELGFGEIARENCSRFFQVRDERTVVPIDGYNHMIELHYSNELRKSIDIVPIDVNKSIQFKDNSLNITEGNTTLAVVNLTKFTKQLWESTNQNDYYHIDATKMEYDYKNSKVKVKFLFDYIELSIDREVIQLDGRVLLGTETPPKN